MEKLSVRGIGSGGLLAVLFTSGALAACVSEAPEDDDLGVVSGESQCGPAWDVQDVERYSGTLGVSQAFVAKHERHVGYHVRPGCTGTLISDDLFISAGHCGYLVNDLVRFDYQVNASGVARATRDFRVTQVVEQEQNASYDYAIVRLADNPGREYGHAAIAAVDPPVGSTVAIIQHPAGDLKKIHAGSVLDYSSGVGANWFRHQVDTVGGSSGSAVLNTNGQLVGIHTNAGCATSAPIAGNSALRMSQLVPHSRTLQALVRSRILWRHTTGKISLWSVNADGSPRSYVEHGPFAGWTPISMANNRILWRHTTGKISFWVVNDAGNPVSSIEHGPYAGWTALNYDNGEILWRNVDGRTSQWQVDRAGNQLAYLENGPYAGWTPLAWIDRKLLWSHSTGKISYWSVNGDGALLGYVEHGPYFGWTPLFTAGGRP
ncbi:MAG TPA: serine protease [Kofleriaceae bacterium]|nr:serine protease [Kofleriaceae bacterium]